jgi:predicted nucleic acid-binding Zn ribbon protein
MEREGTFRSLDEGYQSRIAKDCIEYLTMKSGGDLFGLFEKIFFHTRKQQGEMMKTIWSRLLEKSKSLILMYLSIFSPLIGECITCVKKLSILYNNLNHKADRVALLTCVSCFVNKAKLLRENFGFITEDNELRYAIARWNDDEFVPFYRSDEYMNKVERKNRESMMVWFNVTIFLCLFFFIFIFF